MAIIKFPVEYLSLICGKEVFNKKPLAILRDYPVFLEKVTRFGLFFEWISKTGKPAKEEDVEKLEEIAGDIGVSYGKGVWEAYQRGKELYDSAIRKEILSSITSDILFEWRDKWQYQNEFYKDCFVANLAVRSIIGASEYKPIAPGLIIARMLGLPSLKDYSGKLEKNWLYCTYFVSANHTKGRYQFDKLINNLVKYWGINYHVLKKRTRMFGTGNRDEFNNKMLNLESNSKKSATIGTATIGTATIENSNYRKQQHNCNYRDMQL